MSEAIIARKSIAKVTYKYETIYNNIYVDIEQIIYNPPLSSFVPMSMSYTVPTNLANNQITVALSGAKGSDNATTSGSNGESNDAFWSSSSFDAGGLSSLPDLPEAKNTDSNNFFANNEIPELKFDFGNNDSEVQ